MKSKSEEISEKSPSRQPSDPSSALPDLGTRTMSPFLLALPIHDIVLHLYSFPTTIKINNQDNADF